MQRNFNQPIRSDINRGIESSNLLLVNAIIAQTRNGYDLANVAKNIEKNTHHKVFTKSQQENLLLEKLIKESSKQIGMFTAILILVSIVIIGLIIYTMTIEKLKVISILKLIGLYNLTGV